MRPMRPGNRTKRTIWTLGTYMAPVNKVEGLVENFLRGGSSPLGRIDSPNRLLSARWDKRLAPSDG
jgi:hypothetical protein